MTTEERVIKVFRGEIKGRSEEKDGWVIEALVEGLGQFPRRITRVSADVAARLLPGEKYYLQLQRQNIRKNKDGEVYDGSYAWMYWWGMYAIAEGPDPEPSTNYTPTPTVQGPSDDKEMRIMRQSTLGYAATLTAPIVKDFDSPQHMIEGTIAIGQKLLHYVLTGEMPPFGEDLEGEAPVGDAPEGPVQAPEANVDTIEEQEGGEGSKQEAMDLI